MLVSRGDLLAVFAEIKTGGQRKRDRAGVGRFTSSAKSSRFARILDGGVLSSTGNGPTFWRTLHTNTAASATTTNPTIATITMQPHPRPAAALGSDVSFPPTVFDGRLDRSGAPVPARPEPAPKTATGTSSSSTPGSASARYRYACTTGIGARPPVRTFVTYAACRCPASNSGAISGAYVSGTNPIC
jgi:hypothetical protein